MDGRGRVLRSVKAAERRIATIAPGYAGVSHERRRPASGMATARGAARSPVRRRRRAGWAKFILARLSGPFPSLILALGLFTATGLYGAVQGGHYAAFVAQHGEPADMIARALGFGIDTVTISAGGALDEAKVLEVAGISPRSSLLFLDAAVVRQRLETLALVKRARVAKLYPNRVLIEIEERRPNALWQQDGHVKIVAADGTVLGPFDDARFIDLPHVVGAGANESVADYLALLEAAGDLREKIRAGILVGRRRWTLKMKNGIDIHLPETGAEAAVASLAQLQRTSRILDKDILSLDFRQPGRVVARLSADAAAAHAETSMQRAKSKGGQT